MADLIRRRIAGRTTTALVGALIAAGLLAGCAATPAGEAGGTAAPGADGGTAVASTTLRIATSDDSEFQDAIKEVAAEDGLTVEWVNLDDWVLPNTQVVDGTVDGNAFQHILFLSQFNTQNNATLTPVFSTVITQWGVFSAKYASLQDIPDGSAIAIPDDPSNRGRAIFILEAAGLIELNDGVGNFPTTEDIAENPHGFSFTEIAAKTIPQQFDDPSLGAVVVGTSYFDPSQGITSDSALYLDDSTSTHNLPYVNVVATTQEKAKDGAWAILEQAYADPRVAEALLEENGGATVLVHVPVDELRSKLAELETEAAAG
ncbi:MAG: hypothetical protein J7480_10450 [Microbacteriaceae bacterium]|nr:hypothetical protein [Microbacteriaceae bacterium]